MDLLIGDDDENFVGRVAFKSHEHDCNLVVASTAEALLEALTRQRFDHLVLEPNLPGALWYSLLHGVRELAATLPTTIVTAFPSRALILAAASLGIRRVINKPLSGDELFSTLAGAPVASSSTPAWEPSLARLEWEYINHALRRYRGNVAEASRRLGLPRQTLYRKLRKYPPLR
ncbi:MAG: response regulator [Myxococcales bacterium]|nr:MAG: response regulator [Myxococcales bacterium]